MIKGIYLSDRDKTLLEQLAKCSLLTMEHVKVIYGNKKWYHMRRTTKLKEYGYINKNYGYITLASEGIYYAEENGIDIRPLPKDKVLKQRTSKIIDLMYQIESKLNFIPSWELKEKYNLNRGSRVYGMISGNKDYYIYNLGKKPSDKLMKDIKSELTKLDMVGINKAILLAESLEAIKSWKEESLSLREQLLLPYTKMGLLIINSLASEDIIEKSARLIYGDKLQKPKWLSADYSVENDKQVIVLILNDIEKKKMLEEYYQSVKYNYTINQDVVIICLESQFKNFKALYPNCEIKTVKEKELFL